MQDEGAFIVELQTQSNVTLSLFAFPRKSEIACKKMAMSLLLTNFCKMTWLTFSIFISSRAFSYEKMNEAEPVLVV